VVIAINDNLFFEILTFLIYLLYWIDKNVDRNKFPELTPMLAYILQNNTYYTALCEAAPEFDNSNRVFFSI